MWEDELTKKIFFVMMFLLCNVFCLPSFASGDENGTIGTVPYEYNESSKELRFFSGTLPSDLSIDWDGGFKNNVEKVIFEGEVNTSGSTAELFSGYSNLKKIEGIEKLDTSGVTSMKSMFFECYSLKELDVSGFDTSSVTDMSGMFYSCVFLNGLDVSNFETATVTNMEAMFYNCNAIKTLDLGSFETLEVTNMSYMFSSCVSLKELNITSFDTSKVTDMSYMFSSCYDLGSIDLKNFNTELVTDMSYMFSSCNKLSYINTVGFDTKNVTTMYAMFIGCNSLTELDVSDFDTSNVTDMGYLFSGCSSLENLDVSGFKTANVTNMKSMFSRCSSVKKLDVSNFNTEQVTSMNGMFSVCSALNSLDLSSFNSHNVNDMSDMLFALTNLKELSLGPHLKSLNNTKLPSLDKMNGFDNDLYTGKWQSVGNGTVLEPRGDQTVTSEELMGGYDGTYPDTYVWQKKEQKARLDIRFDLDGGRAPNDKSNIFDDTSTISDYASGETIPDSEFAFFEDVIPLKDGYAFKGFTYKVFDSSDNITYDSGDELWNNSGFEGFDVDKYAYIVFKATWQKEEKKAKLGIRFDLNGGTAPIDKPNVFQDTETMKAYKAGQNVTSEEFAFIFDVLPLKEGYQFLGWNFKVYDVHDKVTYDGNDVLWTKEKAFIDVDLATDSYIVFTAKWEETVDTLPVKEKLPATGTNDATGHILKSLFILYLGAFLYLKARLKIN